MAGEDSAAAAVQQMPFDLHMLLIILATAGVAVVVGGLCGLLNGVLIAVVRIPPILATLGTMKLFEGISFVVTKGSPITSFPKSFLFIGSGSLLHVPMPMVIFALAAVCVGVLLHKSPARLHHLRGRDEPGRGAILGNPQRERARAHLPDLRHRGRHSRPADHGARGFRESRLRLLVPPAGGARRHPGGRQPRGGQGKHPGCRPGHSHAPGDLQRFQHRGAHRVLPQCDWGSLLVVVTAANNLIPVIAARIAERRAGRR